MTINGQIFSWSTGYAIVKIGKKSQAWVADIGYRYLSKLPEAVISLTSIDEDEKPVQFMREHEEIDHFILLMIVHIHARNW